MQDYWQQRSQREKLFLMMGSLIVVSFLLGQLFIIPATQKIQALKTNNAHQRQLIAWLKPNIKSIQALQSQLKLPSKQKETLLSAIEKSLHHHRLDPFAIDMHQQANQHVLLHFKEVPFDQLLHCLDSLWSKHAIHLERIQATRGNSHGTVDADLELSF